ncbi:hypothetical protein OY671_010693, partial [Metschnikowia pulcherrima]
SGRRGRKSDVGDNVGVREQRAASSRFQGLAPGVVASTGALAVALAAWQTATHESNLFIWVLLAAICAFMIGTEAIIRARASHRSMADRMSSTTLNRFMPVAAAGAVAGIVVSLCVPEHARLLPGIWQLSMGVGIFAVSPSSPRQMIWAAAFYFVAAAGSLSSSGQDGTPTAW